MTPDDIAGLCERLRACDTKWLGSAGIAPLFNPDGPQAADTLERQAAENKRLRRALRFYADEHEYPSDGPWGVNSDDFGKRARAALTGED
jgi:hypothetical protein